jgi:hypothetical protein
MGLIAFFILLFFFPETLNRSAQPFEMQTA